MQLFLDMDGVLADFDKRAYEIFGMPAGVFETRFGSKHFWGILQDSCDFYNSFPIMIDAPFLVDAVRHLGPIILTGLPMGDLAEGQKRAWNARHFDLPLIACRSKDKSKHMKAGDIIVDDRTEYRHLWEAKGGIWVHHTSAHDSIMQLRELGVL